MQIEGGCSEIEYNLKEIWKESQGNKQIWVKPIWKQSNVSNELL